MNMLDRTSQKKASIISVKRAYFPLWLFEFLSEGVNVHELLLFQLRL